MHHRILTAVLSFFLLFMQQENVRHVIDHIGARIQRSEHSVLEQPTGDVCLECELLAAGAAFTPTSLATPFADTPAWLVAVVPVARSATAAPSYYHSRAPPPILQSA